MIRSGFLHDLFPATFPSGQGSDFAGVVVEIGADVRTVNVGDEVIGYTGGRASQAEYVAVPAEHLTAKPSGVSWDVAGSLFVAGTTAYAAVRAVMLGAGDTVAVAGAAGGVGSIAVQLAKRTGATILGIAGPANDAWLLSHGVIPVNHGADLAARLKAAAPQGHIGAFLDFFGGGYVALALNDLGVSTKRVNTTIDFAAVEIYGVQSAGNGDATDARVLAELAELIAHGELDVPVAAAYSLDDVRQAYSALEQRHTRGKIVLRP